MLDIRSIPISRVNSAPYNPRKDLKPGDPDFEKLRRSISEFGCVEPLVWNKRTENLVGGHQRLKALVAGGAKTVQVSVVDLSPEREKALNLALNKISGEWDPRKLADLLDELTKTPDFDMGLTGFDPPEIDALFTEVFGEQGLKEESFDVAAALAAQGPTVTQPGDLIELGQHRLLCGDSTDPAQVRRLIQAGGGKKAILFATDPPYLVGYDGTNHPGENAKRKPTRDGRIKASKNKDWSNTYGVTWDDHDANPDLYDKFIGAAVQEALLPNCAWYCWHASRRQAMVEAMWEKHGAFVHCQVIWAKNRPVLTRTWYAWKHEPCFMGWLKGNKPPRKSPQILPTVWSIDTIPNGEDRPDHPTPKPLEVFEIPMHQHTAPGGGDVCYEPFAGSGTQIIAAERLKRKCLAIEISPRYCDVIVRRWIAFVGETKAPPELVRRYAASAQAERAQPAVAPVLMPPGARPGAGAAGTRRARLRAPKQGKRIGVKRSPARAGGKR